MPNTLQQGPGITEAQLAKGSGLRSTSYEAMLLTAQTAVVNAGAITSPTTVYTALTIANGRLCYPSTVCAQMVQSAPATGTVQFRVRGFNQFGDFIEEETPVVAVSAKTNNFIYLAQVFSVIVEVAYKASGMGGTITLNMGPRFDWVRTVDATNDHTAGLNLGIGLPRFLRYRQQGGPVAGVRRFDWNLRPTALAAFMLATVSGTPVAGETFTLDGVVYTWRAASTLPFEVTIGGSIAATCQNFFNAINAVPETPNTTYGAGTTAHPTVFASANSGTVVTVTARQPGVPGNIIATTEATTGLAFSGTTLANGQSSIGELIGVTCRDFGAAGATMVLDVDDIDIGYNVAGWSGSIEKLSIIRNASLSVAPNTYVTGRHLLVSMHILSEDWGA